MYKENTSRILDCAFFNLIPSLDIFGSMNLLCKNPKKSFPGLLKN